MGELKELFRPVLDGLTVLEDEQRTLQAEADAKAADVAKTRRSLRVAGVIEPQKRKRKAKQRKRGAGPETIATVWKVIDSQWGTKPWSTAQLAKKAKVSRHVAYAVVEELRAANRIRLIGRRSAGKNTPAKAKFYVKIEER